MKKFRLHWSIHPHRDLDWYHTQTSRLTTDAVARDLDINYVGSLTGQVFPEFNYGKHVLLRRPTLPNTKPIYRVWDFGATNCVVYFYMDSFHRKYILHERILLPDGTGGNSTDAQVAVALADSLELFPNFQFVDICDPAGSVKHYTGGSTDVTTLVSNNIHPLYERIMSLATKDRKVNARKQFQSDLQKAPAGKEMITIVDADGQGCPTVIKALQGGYCFKKDGNGNVLNTVHEVHPYEDVMDCIFYFYNEAQPYTMDDEIQYGVVSNAQLQGDYF